MDPVQIEELKASMDRDWRKDPKPYPGFYLTNNNAMIRQTKKRIEELSQKAETEYEGWTFDGGEVKMDRQSKGPPAQGQQQNTVQSNARGRQPIYLRLPPSCTINHDI